MITWIVGLCVTSSLAIVGWTVTATLASRIKRMNDLHQTIDHVKVSVQAADVRISVLENKYDTIHAALTEIKIMLQKHLEK
jgi:hypothetical protein